MTTIVSWNIQAGQGVDGRVDLARVANTITSLADADMICMQEIECPGRANSAADQFAALRRLFPRHTGIDGACVERDSEDGPYRFGNLVLSRLPVLGVFRHHLPWPAASGVKHMPRQATEVTVETTAGPLRVVTTHLEFHSRMHRRAQIARLRDLHAEATAHVLQPGTAEARGPYARLERPATSVVCGDFNMQTGSDEYAAMLAPFDDGVPGFIDAWSALHPGRPHDPTCGIFDYRQWPAGAHCRDFFFISEDLRPRLASLTVDTETSASDHQPMALILDDARDVGGGGGVG